MSFDVRTRLSKLKASAKARGLNINLDLNKYQNYIDLGCFYCGSSLESENGYCLDRTNPSKGYTITNVVACCKICNRAKMDMGLWQFADWLRKAAGHTIPRIDAIKDELHIHIPYAVENAHHKKVAKEKNYKLGRLKVVNTDNDD